jgi:hypothetical protein
MTSNPTKGKKSTRIFNLGAFLTGLGQWLTAILLRYFAAVVDFKPETPVPMASTVPD